MLFNVLPDQRFKLPHHVFDGSKPFLPESRIRQINADSRKNAFRLI